MNSIAWHDNQWVALIPDGPERLSRLPHALLLSGRAGLGKRQFGEELAALLLCESPELSPRPRACGKCQGCHWHVGGNHPDFRRVAPDGDEEGTDAESSPKEKKKGSSQIKIDAIRDLEDFVFVGSHRHGRRVVLLTEAEAMNAAAANAVLKILEEPPASVYFILITNQPRRLLATIRSRCRLLPFAAPDASTASAWIQDSGLPKSAHRFLELAAGAPLTVQQWHEADQLDSLENLLSTLSSPGSDPLALAGRWDVLLKKSPQFTLEMLVEGVQRWVFDLTQLRGAGEVRYHRGWKLPDTGSLSIVRLTSLWRELLRFRRSARHPLNQLLFLEDLAAHTLRALQAAH
jgi:DNA polymerase-3 subunit delta'